MMDELKCHTCRKPISTEPPRFISAHSAPDDAYEYICRRCWLEDLAEEAANEWCGEYQKGDTQ